MSARTKPPFRADHVGSLLRPVPLKEARARRERSEITAEQHKDIEDREIEKVVRKQAIKAFYDGCRYFQLDDTAWAMMCDPKEREQSRSAVMIPTKLPQTYARVTNAALEGKPDDVTITCPRCPLSARST